MVAGLNLNLLWVNETHQHHIHFHENDHPLDKPHPEGSTQAIVHECMTDGGIDPSNIDCHVSF